MSGRGRGGRGGFVRKELPTAERVETYREALYPPRTFRDPEGLPRRNMRTAAEALSDERHVLSFLNASAGQGDTFAMAASAAAAAQASTASGGGGAAMAPEQALHLAVCGEHYATAAACLGRMTALSAREHDRPLGRYDSHLPAELLASGRIRNAKRVRLLKPTRRGGVVVARPAPPERPASGSDADDADDGSDEDALSLGPGDDDDDDDDVGGGDDDFVL